MFLHIDQCHVYIVFRGHVEVTIFPTFIDSFFNLLLLISVLLISYTLKQSSQKSSVQTSVGWLRSLKHVDLDAQWPAVVSEAALWNCQHPLFLQFCWNGASLMFHPVPIVTDFWTLQLAWVMSSIFSSCWPHLTVTSWIVNDISTGDGFRPPWRELLRLVMEKCPHGNRRYKPVAKCFIVNNLSVDYELRDKII